MNETDTSNLDPGAYELLVAYLDGELDPEDCQLVEQRLAEDDKFRGELRQLQFAWDLLDELPTAEASEKFTQTTVKMVAVSTEEDLKQEITRRRNRSRVTKGLLAGGVTAAIAAGYLGVTFFLSLPNRQLIQDLPVIEHVDLYEVAGSVEFLQMLEDEQLFTEEIDGDL